MIKSSLSLEYELNDETYYVDGYYVYDPTEKTYTFSKVRLAQITENGEELEEDKEVEFTAEHQQAVIEALKEEQEAIEDEEDFEEEEEEDLEDEEEED